MPDVIFYSRNVWEIKQSFFGKDDQGFGQLAFIRYQDLCIK